MGSYRATYQMEVRHPGLHKYRLLKGTDPYVVEQMATAQMLAWDEMWEKKQASKALSENKQRASQEKEAKKILAAERTVEAQDILSGIAHTLLHTIDVNEVCL